MKHLFDFVKEHLVSEADAHTETLIQELLTCVFYDAYFNGKEKLDKPESIIEYYNGVHDSIIAKIAAMSGVNIKDFDEFMIIPEGAKGRDKSDRIKWHKSFVYQCEAFQKWIDNHKSFSSNLVFVHHDTDIGILNKGVSNNWQIADRVEKGRAAYNVKTKDDYQKADIYAVVHDIDAKPEDDIIDEVEYWVESIEGKQPNKFVGISLKKLLKPISSVHTYGLDVISIKIDEKSIMLNVPIFNDITFNGNLAESKVGGTSSNFKFDADFNGKVVACQIDVRTSGCGAQSRVVDKPKQAHSCFSCQTSLQMTMKGMGGQAGRMQGIVTQWAKKCGLDYSPKVNAKANAGSFKVLIDKIVKAANDNNIAMKHNIDMSGDCSKIIDFIATNSDKLMALLKAYNKSNHELTDEIVAMAGELGIPMTKDNYIDCFLAIFTAIKWKSAAYSALCQFAAIFNEMQEVGKDNLLRVLVEEAKGISSGNSNIHLPYVMIG